jgi:archaellum biogenesis ATPase FlaH/Zn ribbon nucleic-acid-binding protein
LALFLKHADCPDCKSSDALAVYSDESTHCFSCLKTKPSKDWLEANGGKKSSKSKYKETKKEELMTKEVKIISEDLAKEIKNKSSANGNDYRGISNEVTKFFGVRTEYNEEDGEVKARYYPVTKDGTLSGYKIRQHPKSFYSEGSTGNECDLYGSFRFKAGGKYLLIVGGEEDCNAAYQMFKAYSDSKNSDFVTAVVSVTTGETGAAKQIANNYDFISLFDFCVIGFDADEAGRKGTEKILPFLPKGRVKIMNYSKHKDPNDYLLKGDQKAFISEFYNAKQYVPDGILASNQLSSKMREELSVPKIPLPPFMHKLQDMMAGGIPLGRIINLGSASGTGKSTILDECIYYWIFNSPHMVGVVSLESSAGQYGLKILSRHVSNKIELMENTLALDFINSAVVMEKEHDLFNKEDGSPRFYLMDERDGGIEALKDIVENLIISCGVKVIVLDPLQDILSGLSGEEQEMFMKWQKGMVKSHMVTFCNVNHVRKSSGGQKANSTGADLHEEDFHGSSSIFKSGACNLLFTRDKEAEDEQERNTTLMKATKIRWTGKTGVAGKYYYDNQSHTMHDLDDWLQNNGVTEF